MNESTRVRLKRLRMRSWRRGTKEMDLVLGPFSDSQIADLDDDSLALYEALLEENDQDLYQWVSQQLLAPPQFKTLIDQIRRHSLDRIKPSPRP